MLEVSHFATPVVAGRSDGPAFAAAQLQLSELIRAASAALRDQSSKPDDRVQQANAILQRALILEGQAVRVQRAPITRKSTRGGLADWRIRRLKAYVQERLGNGISVLEMARIVGLSPNHFCRAFRATVDETPHNYVLRMRVEQASQLMRTTDLPLSQIAVDCGFADQAHFNKAFRRRTGQSPGAWRRQEVDSNVKVESAVYGDWRSVMTVRDGPKSARRLTADALSREVKTRSRFSVLRG